VASGCSVTPTPTPPLLGAPWYDCAWQERKQITIDHTRVSGDQADFPVLVSLSSDTGLSGNAQNDGDDILFTSSDGTTKLSHEIESYTGGTGTLAAWVKVPSLSSTTDTVIYMYYGNPSAASQQDADNAWEGNFKAVWHHDHDFLDSTANNNDGTNSGSVNTAAKIGRAQDYDGSDDYVDVGSGSSLDDAFAGGGTISAWIYPQGWGGSGYGRVADKATTAGYHTNGWAFMVDNSAIAEGLRFARGFSTTRGGWDTPDNSIDLNTWQYVVTTYNEDSTSNDPIIYINGVAQTLTEGYTPAGTAQADTASNMRIGNWGGGTNRTFDGILDEIRLSTNVRSAGWIVTEYNNQNDPPGFFTLSVEESAPCTPPPTTVPTTPAATLTPSPPWFDCQWTYRRNITINKAYVSGTQANFPVLVSLSSDAGLRDHARSDGYDIVFTTSDGQTEIPYERESYTSSTGALNAWVKVPSISSAANTTIFMYYGDPSSADRANPTGVWDAGFAAVWHLNEAVTDEASAGLHQDSTSYGNTGFQRNNTRATGKIAGAQSFDGTLDWIQIPSSASMNVTSTMTMEGWVNLPAPGGDQKVFYKADPYTTRYQGYGLGVRTAHINYEFWGVNRVRYYNETAGTVPASTWTHLAVSWGKGERIRAYINGALVNISYNGNTNINSTFYDARIGVSSWDIVQFPVTGLVDEVRLSSTNRSAEWILTGYNNQNAPSSFAVIGSQEGYSCGGGSAPAYVQSRGLSYGSASSAAITLPSATTAGNLLVLSLVFDSQALSVSSVSDSKNGAAYNLVSMTNVGTWGKLYTYYVNNSLGGAGAITSTVTLSGTTPSLLDVFLLEYSGVAAMSPFDQTSAGSAASGTAMYSGAKSITNATELIYGFGADDYSCHASGSYTDRETANGQCAVDQSVTITGSYNVTATQSSSGAWALQMATFRGA
jgi:hypothetical protein